MLVDSIPVFSLIDPQDRDLLKHSIEEAYEHAGAATRQERVAVEIDAPDASDTGGLAAGERLKLPPFDDLIGIDPSVYRQIETAVNSGKQHLMFYGPPGTGKTTLARRLAGVLNGQKWTLITGSADWSSQDIIGGYQPIQNGSVKFYPGVLLRNFDRPLIIDELNRCDIDKVIGPLFTVLSGQATTLPYRIDVADADSAQYMILPEWKETPAAHEFAPGTSWRLVTHAKWLRLVVDGAMRAMRNQEGADRPSVLFMLDEFAQLGRLDAVETAMSLNAGYGVKVWAIVQHLGQLKQHYGDNWETFLSGGVTTSFAARDVFTPKHLAELAGSKTADIASFSVGESNANTTISAQKLEALRPDEFRSLKMGEQWVFEPSPTGQKVMKLYAEDFSRLPSITDDPINKPARIVLRPNPYQRTG